MTHPYSPPTSDLSVHQAPRRPRMSRKSIAISTLFLCGILLGISSQWPVPFHIPEWLSWLLTIAFGLSVYMWYYADCAERGYRRRAWLGIFIFLIPALGMPTYLFHSRGLRSGTTATLVAVAVGVGFIAAGALAAMLVVLVRLIIE